MAFGVTKTRIHAKKGILYRCSSCGEVRGSVIAVDQETREQRPHVLACYEHPAAVVLEWSSIYQSAAIWIDQYRRDHTPEEVLEEIRTSAGGRRRSALEVCYQLVELAWHGLPERRIAKHTGGGNPLFGVKE